MNDEITLQIVDTSKIPMNIVCNGFDMKKVIIEVINSFVICDEIYATDSRIDQIAEEIKEAFAVLLGLKQGQE